MEVKVSEDSDLTENANDDPANGHDSRPACVEAIGEETLEVINWQVKGRQCIVLLRCDTGHHTLIDEQALARMAKGNAWRNSDSR